MVSRRHRSPSRRQYSRRHRHSSKRDSSSPPITSPSPDSCFLPSFHTTTTSCRGSLKGSTWSISPPWHSQGQKRSPHVSRHKVAPSRASLWKASPSTRSMCQSSRVWPFMKKIIDYPIPKSLKKLVSPEMYDGIRDPDEHIWYFDTMLRYRGARGPVKCKIFSLNLTKTTLAWF